MPILYNMPAMTVASAPGTGSFPLNAAATIGGITYLTFTSAGVQDGDTVSYRGLDGSPWEVGRGVYTASGPTLTRGLIKSSTGGLINFSANAIVMLVPLAEDFLDFPATVAAAGATQATATQLPHADFIEVISGTGGVALPVGAAGVKRKIRNSTANPVNVYPLNGSSATINNLAANAPFSLLGNTTGYFESSSTLKWFTIP